MESIRRDVTYEKVSFRGFGHCYCRQLKIQNVGNATAENLVITLNGRIQKYEIKKYSEQDYYQEYELSDNIGKQICYSKLPKEGSIVITMNISKSDSLKVEIKHDKGKASEVFSSREGIGIIEDVGGV